MESQLQLFDWLFCAAYGSKSGSCKAEGAAVYHRLTEGEHMMLGIEHHMIKTAKHSDARP